MKFSALGYTLIELLVVISIISLLSVVGFVNFSNFSSDQTTIKAAGQLQTLLRQAQSNASSGVTCLDSTNKAQGGVTWSTTLRADGIDLSCDKNTSVVKSLTLENASIYKIQCSPSTTDSDCQPSGAAFDPPLKVNFSPIFGKTTFSDNDNNCLVNAQTIKIILRNANNSYKCLTISKGGGIDVQ